MDLVGKIKNAFGGKKGFDKVTSEEIRRERIRLEQIEQRLNKDIDEVEKRKKQLFTKGKDETGQRQQIAIARKIKELDVSAQAKDKQLAMVSKQMRVLTGFQVLKENQSLTEELGVSSIVSNMDIDELQAYVERATVEGQFQMERFASLIGTLEGPDGMESVSEDADTLAIVAAMQEAREAESTDPEAMNEDESMKKVDEILRKDKETEADEI